MTLVRKLSARLNANVPGEGMGLADLSIPMPGTAPKNHGAEWAPVHAVAMSADRVYSIGALEAAASGEGEK